MTQESVEWFIGREGGDRKRQAGPLRLFGTTAGLKWGWNGNSPRRARPCRYFLPRFFFIFTIDIIHEVLVFF